MSRVQFSGSVVSDSVRPHGLQHARLPCSSPLPELAQTHVHWISDAIQPSHPLSSPSALAFSLSKHKGPFQGVSSSHQVAKVLEFQLQRQFFQWIFWKNIGWLRLTSLISLQSKGLSRVSMVVLFQIALLSFFPCNYHMRKCEQVWEYLVSWEGCVSWQIIRKPLFLQESYPFNLNLSNQWLRRTQLKKIVHVQ